MVLSNSRVRQRCFEKKTVASPLFSGRDDFENPSADKEPSLTPAGLSQGPRVGE